MLFSHGWVSAQTQRADSLKLIELSEIVVSDSSIDSEQRRNTLPVEVMSAESFRKSFSGNLPQTWATLPGIQSMDIGSGFSKPVIRGMALNRISVVENGIKQEGQQWGADHALEIDPFNYSSANIQKGPASLLYGSDAMAGVIKLNPPVIPYADQFLGEVIWLRKSINASLAASLMLGIKKKSLFSLFRHTEQHFGDYRVPTDAVVYLTQKMPLNNGRLKNTAGFERNSYNYTAFGKGTYKIESTISNVYQKTGFFPGAHGVPDSARLNDDGNKRNIDLPFSTVNHFKWIVSQQKYWERLSIYFQLAYQNNHREEWSTFHTHYDSQPVPEIDPDKELMFHLNTYNANLKLNYYASSIWKHIAGVDVQYQHNRIGGYSFLLPEYQRATIGGFYMSEYQVTPSLFVGGGLRYDSGSVDIEPSVDSYLEAYLQNQAYAPEEIERNKVRSYEVSRNFGDVSFLLGVVWQAEKHLLKANLGKSFRLPGAHELGANGIHHGAFRHEQGNPNLRSEKGLQADISYSYKNKNISFEASSFFNWFGNYIYLEPTGEWSILPHAGQMYRYTETEAFFAGGELQLDWNFYGNYFYHASGDYVYTCNRKEKTALPFSPPLSWRNELSWRFESKAITIEHHAIANQNRISRNEAKTPGVNLMNLSFSFDLKVNPNPVEFTLSIRNIFDTQYYNHLSFYRKIQMPEPGRNFLVLVKVPVSFNITNKNKK
jgi:iron complex outermembrane receptor protein